MKSATRRILPLAAAACAGAAIVWFTQARPKASIPPPASALPAPSVGAPAAAAQVADWSPRPTPVATPKAPSPRPQRTIAQVPQVPREASDAARTQRDAKVRALRSGGDDVEDLRSRAQAVSEQWQALARASGGNVTLGDWECHARGCFLDMQHDTGASIPRMTTSIGASREFMGWNGSKMRSGPIAMPDGSVQVTWFLLAPEAARVDDGSPHAGVAQVSTPSP